jgi:hypothetical protein
MQRPSSIVDHVQSNEERCLNRLFEISSSFHIAATFSSVAALIQPIVIYSLVRLPLRVLEKPKLF